MSIVRIMAFAAVAAMVAGCSDKSFWLGSWLGHRPITVPPQSDPSVAETLSRVTLEIKPDGSFSLYEEGFGKEGTASLGDHSATLTIRSVLGRPAASLGVESQTLAGERALTRQPNGDVLFVRPGSPPLVLKRTRKG